MIQKIIAPVLLLLFLVNCNDSTKIEDPHEFDKGSKIDAIVLTPEKVEDLTLLGQVWGFLKYYHPSITQGKYNWDYELFRIMPKIIASESDDDRNQVLLEWIKSLGEIEKGHPEKIKPENIKLLPDYSWITEKKLGSELKQVLTGIKNAKRSYKSHYVGLMEHVGNPEFKNEDYYPAMTNPDLGFRLLCLYRYWNIIQYYFPNKHLIGENWNNVLKTFIPKFINVRNELEYKKCVLSLTGRIHDSHAFFKEIGSYPFRKSIGDRYAPFLASFIENKFVVTYVGIDKRAQETGIKIGDVITEINEKPIEEIIKERLEFIPGSNYSAQLRDLSLTLLSTPDSILTITYVRSSATKKIIVPCKTYNYHTHYHSFGSEVDFKMIGSDISYIYPGLIKNDSLPKIIEQILKTKGLIIDFRCYPSDFTVFSLGQHLVPDSTSFAIFTLPSIETPGLFQILKFSDCKIGYKNKNYYKGKVIILVNEETQSSAEYHCMAFQTAPRATVIGSTTAGADGNVSSINLPGGINTMISGIGILYPDGRESQRVGVTIDIIVKPTIKGIREGRDELMEKAIELIN